MASDRIEQHGALTHQQIPRAVKHQNRLTISTLDRNKPHRRARHCLADRLGIRLTPAFDIGLHISWQYQLHFMPEGRDLPSLVVRRGASLHADKTVQA